MISQTDQELLCWQLHLQIKKNQQIKNYTTVYPTAMLTMKYIHVVWMMN